MPRLLFITILLFSVAISAQERKYQRKSISSLGLLNLSFVNVPSAMIENRINFHIQLPRFDYNSLSDSALSAYRERVSALGFRNATPSQITAILNETIIPQVSLALKAVAEERALGNLKEEDLAMAAANKLKGSGLTAEDILKVLNTAYLYVPVVARYNESTDEENNLTVEISGYILWFRVKTNPDGNAEAVFLKGGSVMQSGTATTSKDKNYKTRQRTLPGGEYARLSAIEAWARNLSLAMRRLPDFQVTAEILSLRGATPEANIGTREGVGLDDGFYAEELFENSKGELETRRIGFFRVASVGDNRKNQSATSTFIRTSREALSAESCSKSTHSLDWILPFDLNFSDFVSPKKPRPCAAKCLANTASMISLSQPFRLPSRSKKTLPKRAALNSDFTITLPSKQACANFLRRLTLDLALAILHSPLPRPMASRL